MKAKSIFLSLFCFTLLCVPAWAVPAVTNIVGVQRAGTKLVDVTFDVAAPGVTTSTVL